MAFNWYQSAERCMKRLSEDFLRIKRDYIDKGNYIAAYNKLQFSLSDSNHMAYEEYITDNFHSGVRFNASIELLRKALEKRDKEDVEFASKSLLACIGQQNLRREVIERS